jgi:hypothetical protein
VGLDAVVVPPAFLLLHHVAGIGQVGDDGEGAPLGDPDALGDVAEAQPRVVGDADQDASVIGEKAPALRTPDSS